MTARPVSVTFEHHREPVGIGEAEPRISWRSEGVPGWRQSAYEIEVRREGHVRRFGPVESDTQILVSWPDAPLRSRERAEARVRLTGDGEERAGEWSDWTRVEAGLLSADEWVAVPVGGAWREEVGTDRRPSMVRREFELRAPIARARLYASAHGVYEAEINGERIGREILAPGWTSYSSRLRYHTYDVTSLLREGRNALGAWLGDGWYRGRLGFNGGHHDLYGTDLSFIGQLEVELTTGERITIATDSSWSAAFGPILFSGLYDGERYDARLEQQGWSEAGFTGEGWSPVAVHERDPRTLVAPMQPPVRCTQEVEPVEVTRLDDGVLLVDFGQNLVGRVRLRVDGPAGQEIEIQHAEVLQNGRLYRRTLRQAASIDTLTLDGEGERFWEPRFTIHGFRYAEIRGLGTDIRPGDVVARVYHTDMERTGWFESSDPLLDRLHENVLWSTKGNFVDIPTDCPQRDERLGWTGDIQVFTPTASFLYDCSGMLSSWLVDVAGEQLPDGTVPWFVPSIPGGPSWNPIEPGAVWDDVVVLTPWALYQRFGDTAVLERQYPSAKAWVDLVERLAGPDRLWNEGFQLGDWLDPAAPPEDPAAALTDKYLVATAYFAWSARHLALTAEVLGKHDDARRYRALSEEVRQAFVAEYVSADGRMSSDAQTAYALAIAFELVPDDLALSSGSRLAELVREGGNRIATGFAGTPLVADALASTGHVDSAYDLLLETSNPSWLYTVLQGGTTIWERWDSMLPDGTVNPGEMTSFNHYALGAVADWMHRDIAGLAPAAPGYREVLIRPRLGGRLSRASAKHVSPYGAIEVGWRIDGSEFRLTASLPIGVTARVELPDGATAQVGPGTHEFSSAVPQTADEVGATR